MAVDIEGINRVLATTGEVVAIGSLCCEQQQKVSDAKSLYRAVREFAAKGNAKCEGWICFTDRIVLLPDEPLPENSSDIILNGELASGEESLQIRQCLDGWSTTMLKRLSEGAMLVAQERFQGSYKGRNPVYEVFWNAEENKEGHEVYKPFGARFAGFAKGGNES